MRHYRWEGNDLLLACHVQPGARSEGFAGLHGERTVVDDAGHAALDAHADQVGDVEEASPIDLIGGGAPPGEAVMLPFQQTV